jgi:hypothetical protein
VIILDPSIKRKVSISLNTNLFSSRFVDDDIYELLGRDITIGDLNDVFKNLLQSKSDINNIGIDLPIWFGDYTSTNKTMVVALDPKRNKQDDKAISVSSIFSLHTEDGKNTNKNDYWNFVSYLAQSSFVYLTDIYKIYYQTKDRNGQNLLSNKDKSFTEEKCYAQNKSILEDEILRIVKPNRIITLGGDAAKAVKRIKDIKTSNIQFHYDGIEYIFLPHISRTVTQSIKTIGNLYKGLGIISQRPEIEHIGDTIIKNSELKNIFLK